MPVMRQREAPCRAYVYPVVVRMRPFLLSGVTETVQKEGSIPDGERFPENIYPSAHDWGQVLTDSRFDSSAVGVPPKSPDHSGINMSNSVAQNS